jgi:5-enolpyruvylshikimate-3-phosphate synthase
VGVHVEARPDGMVVPAGAQTPRDGASWPTHHDHRIAMAGLLLTLSGAALRVEGQGVVAKSYPEIWRHARALGWSVL